MSDVHGCSLVRLKVGQTDTLSFSVRYCKPQKNIILNHLDSIYEIAYEMLMINGVYFKSILCSHVSILAIVFTGSSAANTEVKRRCYGNYTALVLTGR